jgi:hypothetical protein
MYDAILNQEPNTLYLTSKLSFRSFRPSVFIKDAYHKNRNRLNPAVPQLGNEIGPPKSQDPAQSSIRVNPGQIQLEMPFLLGFFFFF